MALLKLERVTKHFGGLAAVDDVSLAIDKGEIRGLIGPNGAGKTTLINVIGGTFRPTRGKVLFKGRNITGLRPDRLAEEGLVRTFQANLMLSEATVLESVVLGYHLHTKESFLGSFLGTHGARSAAESTKQQAIEMLKYVGLTGQENMKAEDMPHGFQRVLSVASALAVRPELLMLDEPATGMNPKETEDMMNLIRRVRDRGTTILLVEHNMKVVMGLCNRITVLNYGKKIAEGSTVEVKNSQAVIEAYLGTEEGV